MSELAERPAVTPAPLKRRLYGMMFLQYFVQGSYLPVISVYLQDALGYTPDQIGQFMAALAVGPLAAPFLLGQLVDRHFATEKVLAVCHVVAGITMLALYFQTEFWTVMALGTIYSTLYVPSLMLTNSLTFRHLADRDREFPRIRLWGTIGFIVPAWVVELYFLQGLTGAELNSRRGIILLLAGVSGLVMAGYSLTLPHTPPNRDRRGEFAPGQVLGLLRRRNFLTLVLISFLIALVHKFYFTWNAPFLKAVLQQGDIRGAWEQRISSLGQVAEVGVMAVLGLILKQLGFKRTLLVGGAAYLLRCLLFAWAVCDLPFAASLTLACLGQALHGLCFGCFIATAYMYVDRVAPPDVRGSMQTFYGTFVLSVGGLLGGLFAGRIGQWFASTGDAPLLRDRWGIESRLGLVPLEREGSVILHDWPGIWLSAAAVALVAFALLFPRDREPAQE